MKHKQHEYEMHSRAFEQEVRAEDQKMEQKERRIGKKNNSKLKLEKFKLIKNVLRSFCKHLKVEKELCDPRKRKL